MNARLAWLAVALLAAPVAGQVGDLEFCTVIGRVADESGRIVTGVRVEIRPAATAVVEQPQRPFESSQPSPDEQMSDVNRDRTVFAWGVSDREGWYRIPGVRKPGAYMLVVRAQVGFRDGRVPLSISAAVGEEFRADVTLQRLPARTATVKRSEFEAALSAARSAEELGDLATADRHLQAATQLEPDSPIPHYHRARLALLRGDLPGARRESGLAVGRSPSCADCWVVRARAERAAKNAGSAREAAEKAIALAPDLPAANGVLGIALYDAGKYAEALPYLEGAAAGGDSDPNVHLYLANAFVQQRQTQLAATAYRAYLERFPDAPNRGEVERMLEALIPQP
jgi:Flp pilus assembly protein TadD